MAAKPAVAAVKVAVAVVPSTEFTEMDPLDWPMWRGPEQNGISRETGLIDQWDPSGENVL